MYRELIVPLQDVNQTHPEAIKILNVLGADFQDFTRLITGMILETARVDTPTFIELEEQRSFCQYVVGYCYDIHFFKTPFQLEYLEPLSLYLVDNYNRLLEYIAVAIDPQPTEFVSGWGIRSWIGQSPIIFIEYTKYR